MSVTHAVEHQYMGREIRRYEAALERIKNWKGYKPGPCYPPSEYETGANDMLATLAEIAEEALTGIPTSQPAPAQEVDDEPKF